MKWMIYKHLPALGFGINLLPSNRVGIWLDFWIWKIRVELAIREGLGEEGK